MTADIYCLHQEPLVSLCESSLEKHKPMWKFPFFNMQTNLEYVEFLSMTITDNEWKHICLYWKLLASSKLLVINEYTDKAFVLYAAIKTVDNVIKYILRFTRLFENISCAKISLVCGHALCVCMCFFKLVGDKNPRCLVTA